MPAINRQNEKALSLTRLREVLGYSPVTGRFVWLKSTSNRVRVGANAGCYNDKDPANRYVLVTIEGRTYLGHRLAWFYQTGEWPNEIDHIDGDGWNNRWANLRQADVRENARNAKRRTDNRSGVRGVAYYDDGRSKPYQAWVDHTYLGSFETLEQATAARETAARRAHGAFYRE